MGHESPVSENRSLDSVRREDVSTEAISQDVPSGVDQKTSSSRKSSERGRRRNNWDRRSNSSKKVDPSNEIVKKTELKEAAENSAMDARLLPNNTELLGNTAKALSPSSESSKDAQAVVPNEKTKPSS